MNLSFSVRLSHFPIPENNYFSITCMYVSFSHRSPIGTRHSRHTQKNSSCIHKHGHTLKIAIDAERDQLSSRKLMKNVATNAHLCADCCN